MILYLDTLSWSMCMWTDPARSRPAPRRNCRMSRPVRSKLDPTIRAARFLRLIWLRIAGVSHVCYVVAMSKTINQRELRNHSAAVLREVQAGQSLIVTRNGEPVAELRPIQPRRFVPKAAIAEAAGRAVRIDAKRFRADIDAAIDQSIDV